MSYGIISPQKGRQVVRSVPRCSVTIGQPIISHKIYNIASGTNGRRRLITDKTTRSALRSLALPPCGTSTTSSSSHPLPSLVRLRPPYETLTPTPLEIPHPWRKPSSSPLPPSSPRRSLPFLAVADSGFRSTGPAGRTRGSG